MIYSGKLLDLPTAGFPAAPKADNIMQLPQPQCPANHMSVRNLSVSYHGKKALNNVNMDIRKGRITALIGPSGCGKSSFLSALSRMTDLIPGCEVGGNIFFNETDIHGRNVNVLNLRRAVGKIFQKPNPFPLSIRENIAMPLREHGLRNRSEREDRVQQALTDVGLWQEVSSRLGQSALSLSGGQQQRLCIARALALDPAILLMDEPCSALDPMSSKVIEDMIQRLMPKYTIVIVTHNLAQARRISDFAAVFWANEMVGTVIEFGSTKMLFENPVHELTAAYISGLQG
jgi:phosphate transport system ATP-binding protein